MYIAFVIFVKFDFHFFGDLIYIPDDYSKNIVSQHFGNIYNLLVFFQLYPS